MNIHYTSSAGRTQLTVVQSMASGGESRLHMRADEQGSFSLHSSIGQPVRPTRRSDAPPAYDAIQASRPLPPITRESIASTSSPPLQCYICHPDHDDAEQSTFVCAWDESNHKPHDSNGKLASAGYAGSDTKAVIGSSAITNAGSSELRDPRSLFRRLTDDIAFAWRGVKLLRSCESELGIYRHVYGDDDDDDDIIWWHPDRVRRAASSVHRVHLKANELRSLCEDRAPEIRGDSDTVLAGKLEEIDLAIKEKLGKLHELSRKYDVERGRWLRV
ncbi:hypothetical protein PENSPDRAFT_748210 [Peniophora sp. CONT]|nr:hypothetical protein PENSPDRAFT_748210 [Peniophora sp. CONT]